MRIVIIGLGSIGRRYLSCLKALGIECIAFRSARGTLKESGGVPEVYTVEDALAFNAQGVIISNPTSLHVDSALPFLQHGIKTFIEKPVSDSLERSKSLEEFDKLIVIGYSLRFLKLNILLSKIFQHTPPFKVSFKRSYYLPKWHPYADYRYEYTAKKELGGGVLRTLSHEIDLAVNWFGVPTSVVGTTDRISSLEINTDDFALFTLKTKNGARINFELDFFSPVNINLGEAFTKEGKYHWNNDGLFFTGYDSTDPVLIGDASTIDYDEMYMKQIEDFIAFIKTGRSSAATLREGQEVMKIIELVDGKF